MFLYIWPLHSYLVLSLIIGTKLKHIIVYLYGVVLQFLFTETKHENGVQI